MWAVLGARPPNGNCLVITVILPIPSKHHSSLEQYSTRDRLTVAPDNVPVWVGGVSLALRVLLFPTDLIVLTASRVKHAGLVKITCGDGNGQNCGAYEFGHQNAPPGIKEPRILANPLLYA